MVLCFIADTLGCSLFEFVASWCDLCLCFNVIVYFRA